MIAFPPYGAAKSARKIINMAASLEKLANTTSEGFHKTSAELVAMRTTVMHNRITLDMLLAEKGGTCSVIGAECCTYIPDNSEEIDNLANKIKAEGANYHNFNKGWSMGSWLMGIFGRWEPG